MERRTDLDYHNNLSKDNSYDDSWVREKSIEVYELFSKRKLINNPDKYGIDMLYKDDMSRGVELEHGGFINFWEDVKYYQKCTELDYPHVNIPERKLKFWTKKEYYVPPRVDGGVKQLHDNIENYKDTIFFRMNKLGTQFIIIRPEIIHNEKYVVKNIYCNNSQKIEKYMCFKRDDVETYNLIDGKWVLENETK